MLKLKLPTIILLSSLIILILALTVYLSPYASNNYFPHQYQLLIDRLIGQLGVFAIKKDFISPKKGFYGPSKRVVVDFDLSSKDSWAYSITGQVVSSDPIAQKFVLRTGYGQWVEFGASSLVVSGFFYDELNELQPLSLEFCVDSDIVEVWWKDKRKLKEFMSFTGNIKENKIGEIFPYRLEFIYRDPDCRVRVKLR